jgi:hypothetical protein
MAGIGEAIALNIVSQLSVNCILIANRLIRNPGLSKIENKKFLLRLRIQIGVFQAIKDTVDVPHVQKALKASGVISELVDTMEEIYELLRKYIKYSVLPSEEKVKLLEESAAGGLLERMESEKSIGKISERMSKSKAILRRILEETVWTMWGRDRNEQLVTEIEFWADNLDRLASWTIPSSLRETSPENIIDRLGSLKRTKLKSQMVLTVSQAAHAMLTHSDPTELDPNQIRILQRGRRAMLQFQDCWKTGNELGRAGQRQWAELTQEGLGTSQVIVEFSGAPANHARLQMEDNAQWRADLSLLVRILRLAGDKPETFRVLYCRGWYETSDHFGLVYRFPENRRCECLANILLNETNRICLAQALENRVSLARTLAWTLFEFHSSNWVHRSFNPDNILLFETNTEGTLSWDWSSPYVVGFSVSRAENGQSGVINQANSDVTPYLHPDRQGKKYIRFQRRHDLYSLGVVLLEIGKVRSLLDDGQKAEWLGKNPDNVKAILVRKAQGLRVTMGSRYAQAVLACLSRGMKEEVSSQDEFDFLNYFRVQVCEKLDEIVL